MNKKDLVSSIAKTSGLTLKESEVFLNSFMEQVTQVLQNKDGKITLAGFGTFEVKTRKARVGRNPKTLEKIDIAETDVPVFRPGKALKEATASTKKSSKK